MQYRKQIKKYSDLPITNGNGHANNHFVTITYKDTCGNARVLRNIFTREDNYLWQRIMVKTGKVIPGLGQIVEVEWQKVCHKRDITSIVDTYGNR